MNITDMKPGRELDALVAEKVMNFKRGTHVESGLVGWFREDGTLATNCFRPSTDISAAWEVFTHFGWQGAVGYSGSNDWFCEIMYGFSDIDGTSLYAKSVADTAPEAICKAALMALEEKS